MFVKSVHKNVADSIKLRIYLGSPDTPFVSALLLIFFPINKANHNTTKTHLKLPFDGIKNTNTITFVKKLVLVITHSRLLQIMISPFFDSLSFPHWHISISTRCWTLFCRRRLFKFVNFYIAHIHCADYYICNYKLFFFNIATNSLHAAQRHFQCSIVFICASPTVARSCCCNIVNLQPFPAVRKLTQELQQRKSPHPKRPKLLPGKLAHPRNALSTQLYINKN